MSDAKFFSRPKVRFCQTDTDELATNRLKKSKSQKSLKQSNKPKITSIVTLDKPVRLVKLNETAIKGENKDSKAINNVQNIDSLTSCSNVVSSSSLNKNSIKIESQTPLNDANNIQNIKANCKEVDTAETSAKPSSNDTIIPKTSSIEENENLDKPLRLKHYAKSHPLKKDNTKDKKGKENEQVVAKKGVKATTIRSLDLDILKHKSRVCSASASTKKLNVANKTPVSAAIKRPLNSKPVADVMPCYKYTKAASKIKTPAVKKTVIRDIIGPKIKPCISSGIQHEKPDNLKFLETDESAYTKSVISGEKLARPEYNSIMCIINKLNEMKKQKVVTDIEHLPATYKGLINEKVSNGLDFPLDEAIYRNLVDLTIDENQLPNRLTRSKDPEPRQRDVVPVLTDFFTPASTEEYCTAVCVKPRAPEIVDSWNAFRISDQICEWKHILDDV